ncbi:MAG TPA: Nif3-like dinuclear metal center hexameric protein [Ignavibacteriaceae bacterium]|nr:Nif3-like dinuclear metal center hexameric protein [Ignavibacteriaceae bacterium]
MKINEILKHIEDWAPPGIAWDKDNPGIQVGSAEARARNVLICLDLTREIVKEAVLNKCNLIISHHPLIFNPIRKIQISDDPTSQLIELLIKNNITLYSAHTNLDFSKNGVSFQLAKTLGLKNISFLKALGEKLVKLVVFVPEDSVEKVSEALFSCGAGIIGEYTGCSFKTRGKGTFRPSESANPAIGKRGKFEEVNEIRLEVVANSWQVMGIVDAMRDAHPYEEPAYDIYPIRNPSTEFGFGAIGELEEGKSENEFLDLVCAKLNANGLKFSPSIGRQIRKVAVCGGSGSELLDQAIACGADAFLTADVRYHTYFNALGKILLIDGGHFETEVLVFPELKRYIQKFFKRDKISVKVLISKHLHSPVKVYNYSKRSK